MLSRQLLEVPSTTNLVTEGLVAHTLYVNARRARHRREYLFRPLPGTLRGNAYIFLYTECSCRRDSMFTATAAVFTPEGTVNV